MSESFKVKFTKREQRQFLQAMEQKIPIVQMAKVCKCSERTIRDWRREKFPMDHACLEKLCRKTNTLFPSAISLMPRYSHTSDAGRKGAAAVLEKYGRPLVNELHRKQQWQKWWKQNGQFKKSKAFVPRTIKKPRHSAKLAEFCGIMLGDGGITQRQISIFLHRTDDKAYMKFVAQIIVDLFGTPFQISDRKDKGTQTLVVSRTALVNFCIDQLGLKVGNKTEQQVSVPKWIMKRHSFRISCLRGLIDTDGCVVIHRYTVKGKKYHYKKLQFCSASKPLREKVALILNDLELPARIKGRHVWLDSKKSVRSYFKTVGSNNPKHLKRYSS